MTWRQEEVRDEVRTFLCHLSYESMALVLAPVCVLPYLASSFLAAAQSAAAQLSSTLRWNPDLEHAGYGRGVQQGEVWGGQGRQGSTKGG